VRVRLERLEARFEPLVLVAALLVIPVLVIQGSHASASWRHAAAVADWLIWAVFIAEGVVALAAAEDRLRWLRTHPLEIAVVVLTPPFLPSGLQSIRILRLLRLLRLMRIVQLARRLFTLEGLRYVAVLAGITLFAGGAAFSAAEGRNISAWDGIWWAITTMTTVGYGDVSPHTNLGKAIAIVVMLVGIGFVALLTAALAERFVARDVGELEERQEISDHELLETLQAIRDRLDGMEAAIKARPAR
jgi:voltage-gated potassium channel